MAKKKTNNSGLRRTLIVLSIVLGLILAVLVCVTVYAEFLLGKVNYVDPDATEPTLAQEQINAILNETDPAEQEDSDFTGPEMKEEDMQLETAAPIQANTENVVNILLIGADRRKNEPARSDSMILCTFNKTQGTITLTSFMRDMYVKIPGYKSNRINVAYILGGMGLLDATLKHNFGVEVDYNVEVDFSGFQDIINLLGGIEMDITQKEADWMNKQLERTEFTEGVNLLDGSAALFYARIRKIDSDFDRSNRQKKILSAVLDEVRDLSLLELVNLSNEVMPMITTDMPVEVMFEYIMTFFPIVAQLEVSSQTVPAEGTYKYETIEEMSVILPDYKANKRILKETIGK